MRSLLGAKQHVGGPKLHIPDEDSLRIKDLIGLVLQEEVIFCLMEDSVSQIKQLESLNS